MRVEDRMILSGLYGGQPLPLDRLPYTEHFDRLVTEFNRGRPSPLGHKEVWEALLLVRKSGKLPKKRK